MRRRAPATPPTPTEWGYRVSVDEGKSFYGRWRGETTDEDNGNRRILLVWDEDGQRCFWRFYAALGREIDRVQPSVGCSIAIFRGDNYKTQYDADGETSGHAYGVEKEPNDAPLPQAGDGDAFPFWRVDFRSDELLERAARAAWRHRLALAWSNSLTGPAAKRCSRGGSARWPMAVPLPEDEGAAVGFFTTRARKRNPAVVASASGLVLVEADLEVADDAYPALEEVQTRVAGLMRRLELRFPPTVIVRSRRGLHFYLRPPDGREPAKFQLSEEGDRVTFSSDGYLIGVPGLHELPGVVYEYVRDGKIAEMPAAVYEQLVKFGDAAWSESRRAFDAGEPIPTGNRRETIFSLALERARDAVGRTAIVEELQAVNAAQCRPPLAAAPGRRADRRGDPVGTEEPDRDREGQGARSSSTRLARGRRDWRCWRC